MKVKTVVIKQTPTIKKFKKGKSIKNDSIRNKIRKTSSNLKFVYYTSYNFV